MDLIHKFSSEVDRESTVIMLSTRTESFANSTKPDQTLQNVRLVEWTISNFRTYAKTSLYITVRYNTVLDITRFKYGSQKCIDYIENDHKWSFFNIIYTFLFG